MFYLDMTTLFCQGSLTYFLELTHYLFIFYFPELVIKLRTGKIICYTLKIDIFWTVITLFMLFIDVLFYSVIPLPLFLLVFSELNCLLPVDLFFYYKTRC